MISIICRCGFGLHLLVVKEGDEFERRSSIVAYAVHAATLCENHAARPDWQLFELFLAEAENLPLDGGEAIGFRIIANAQISYAFAFGDEVKLFRAYMLVITFDFAGRNGDFVEEDHRPGELPLKEPAHLYNIVVAGVWIPFRFHHSVAITHRFNVADVLIPAALEVNQIASIKDGVSRGTWIIAAPFLVGTQKIIVPSRSILADEIPERQITVAFPEGEGQPLEPLDVFQKGAQATDSGDGAVASHLVERREIVMLIRRRLQSLPDFYLISSDPGVKSHLHVSLRAGSHAVRQKLKPDD